MGTALSLWGDGGPRSPAQGGCTRAGSLHLAAHRDHAFCRSLMKNPKGHEKHNSWPGVASLMNQGRDEESVPPAGGDAQSEEGFMARRSEGGKRYSLGQ